MPRIVSVFHFVASFILSFYDLALHHESNYVEFFSISVHKLCNALKSSGTFFLQNQMFCVIQSVPF